ncbi:unnamed protein product, partial [Rotaria sp. Silwood1]
NQPNVTRVPLPPPPPPPPPPSNSSSISNNNGHTPPVTLNPEHVAKFNMMMNQNGPSSSSPSPPPLPPPRGMAPNNSGGTTRRAPGVSDFVDNTPAERRFDQWNTAALDYDRDFEHRFRFTPIEHLPPPGLWKQPSSTKSSKTSNVN